MNNLPFDKPGRFWRGNLHTHSTVSDGQLSPEEVCRLYRRTGYDFISLTDHFMARYDFPITDTRPFRSQNFTTILGAELHTGQTELGMLWHILAVGLPLDFAPHTEGETGPEIAGRALEAGAYVAAAHPAWNTTTENDILSLGPVHAIEIFNGTAVDHNDRAYSWHVADILLARGERYMACATDDLHSKAERADFARGWVQVKSERLEPDDLLAALKRGAYYSSTGPEIHDVRIEPGVKAVVRCSPAARVFVTGRGAASAAAFGNGIVEAEIDLTRFDSPYARITVRDASGGRAWTNPFWFE